MDIAKTITLYNLDDVTFTLSDDRASKLLDDFGKTAYSATNKETVWLLEEYDRRHGRSGWLLEEYDERHEKPGIIFDTALRYYMASEIKDKVSTITTPVDELYHYFFNIRPLESLHTEDNRKIASTIRLKDPLPNKGRDSMLTPHMRWFGLPQIGVSAKEAIRKA